MDALPKATTADSSADQFLLDEYATLREFRQNTVTLRETRLNFFLAIISGAIVGLALLNQLSASGLAEIVNFLTGVIMLGVFWIGLITFNTTIAANFRVVEYTRGMNRIRRYFVEQHTAIEKYVALPLSDQIPSFGDKMPMMTALINSLIGGTGISLFAHAVMGLATIGIYLVGALIFAIFLIGQYRYYLARVQQTITQGGRTPFMEKGE